MATPDPHPLRTPLRLAVCVVIGLCVGAAVYFEIQRRSVPIYRELGDGRYEIQSPNGDVFAWRSDPVFEWRPALTETIVVRPSGIVTYGPFPPGAFRADISAASPVQALIVPGEFKQSILSGRVTWDTIPAHCERRVPSLQFQLSCESAAGDMLLVIRDDRAAPDAVSGVAALALGYLGNSEPSKRMTLRNDVALTFYVRQCVKYC